jgi:hypothetical protein
MPKWSSESSLRDLTAFGGDLEAEARHRFRLRLFWVLVILAAGGIAFAARPAYRWLSNQMIDRNLEEAKAAARLEDWGTARNLARSVLLARRSDFEAYRIWFQALAHIGDPRTYTVAAALFADPRASDQDRLEALKVLALQAPQAVAFSAYASLSKEQQQQPAALAALAPLLIQRGESAYVEKVLRASPDLATNPAIRLELLRALCSRPSVERVAEARSLFADLIKAEASEPALEALCLLAETPGGLAPGPPLPALPEWVNRQPKATTLHHLFALHPALEAAPTGSEAVFQKAINRFLPVDPGTLGTWLTRHNQADRAAGLLAEPATTSPTAFISRMHALINIKDTAAITAALSTPPATCDLVDLALVKVAAARLQRDSAAETVAWNQALENAAFDYSRNRFIELCKFAEILGASKVLDDCWVAAVRLGWGQLPLYGDLKRIFGSLSVKRRSEDMLAMFATLLRFEPHNPELLCNYYYLALLHGVITPATAVKSLEALTTAHPESTDFLPALTMAYLMADQPADALRQIPIMKASTRMSPLAWQCLEATSLLLTGDVAAGSDLLKAVNWSDFMDCETVAFRTLLNRPKFKDLPLPAPKPAAPALSDDEIPAWRKAVERLGKARQNDTLPALPAPKIPGSDRPMGVE